MKDISDKRVNISLDNPSITFDKNKCDECSICKNICKFNVGVYGFSKDDYPCINCGSCTLACPNKCLSEKPVNLLKLIISSLNKSTNLIASL